ncbi:MAG TPA: hypothetical protein VF665_05080 [Longimicrobium sp.]|jgi:hypothetical protein|uniref:hypothetical protein n=1 Tax=Longimicrobium sp. TaxID=2029185 RepID=UPI002EDAD9EA
MSSATLTPRRLEVLPAAAVAVSVDPDSELSDDQLECVVGGLARVLPPVPTLMPVQAAA